MVSRELIEHIGEARQDYFNSVRKLPGVYCMGVVCATEDKQLFDEIVEIVKDLDPKARVEAGPDKRHQRTLYSKVIRLCYSDYQ